MSRQLAFDVLGWEDYTRWQGQARTTLKRLNLLIKDGLRDPFTGTGKSEPLKHILSGAWSRRIDEASRRVYLVTDTHIVVLQAREPESLEGPVYSPSPNRSRTRQSFVTLSDPPPCS